MPKYPEYISAAKLADGFKLSERQMHVILQSRNCPAEKGKGYDTVKALRGIAEYYQQLATEGNTEHRRDKARITAAEATMAELEAGEAAGRYADLDTTRKRLEEIFIEYKNFVRSRTDLTPVQKVELCAKLAGI